MKRRAPTGQHTKLYMIARMEARSVVNPNGQDRGGLKKVGKQLENTHVHWAPIMRSGT